MPLFDVKCLKCGLEGECFLESGTSQAQCPRCDGYAPVVWRSFGGMMGKNKGVFPYYDKQLGVRLESSQHRDKICKERGLIALSTSEYNRTMNNQHDTEPDLMKQPEFIEAMEKAYYEIEHGMVQPDPGGASLDASKGGAILDGGDFKSLPQAPKA